MALIPPLPHSFDVSVSEATRIQKELRDRVRIKPLSKEVRTIAGVDVSLTRGEDTLYAGIVLLSFPELRVMESAFATGPMTFPYVPGYLSFREIPILLKAYEKLSIAPDVLIADGQGIAHPRRLGIATHLGLVLDIPTVGFGKSLLYGTGDQPASEAGSVSYIVDTKDPKEVIGAWVRTKRNVKPIIVSPGKPHNSRGIDSACLQDCSRLPHP